ncbi:MAG TPA: hypothetical protein VKP30_05875 [Polyangiaceae bacterium]|nr:hypothetical protein [Polyangiaceae bacterium]
MTTATLVQILLPLSDNESEPHPPALFMQVRQELVAKWGGVTAHLAAPAQGVWRDEGHLVVDSIVVIEAMVEGFDRRWWYDYRVELEARFRQQEIVVRALAMERV